MSLVIVAKLVSVEEKSYETARGPQTDLIMTVSQAGQEYQERLVVSYKAWDKAKAFKPGDKVSVPLFLEVKPGGKKGHWIQKIAMDIEPAA